MIVAQSKPISDDARTNRLLARPMGIDTYQELVIYMRADCGVCRSEGFESQSRVRISRQDKELVATLNVVSDALLAPGEAGLSDAAWKLLGARSSCLIEVTHPEPVESFRWVRGKLYGRDLNRTEVNAIVADVAARRYSDVQLSAFLSAGVGERLSTEEVIALTDAMVAVGQRLQWSYPQVLDKHCVGGLPGNRTTPLVVAIVAACGLVMPKTSSRAITSPAGTADTMGVLTRVDLSLAEMRSVVEREGGCLVWGGAVDLSPADDLLIRVERALDLDSEAQLVASVLSKKIAAGSTAVVIDIPVGPTAKVRTKDAAQRLSSRLTDVGSALGLEVKTILTDGSQPVGRGIGPVLEAEDVLAVLRNEVGAPADLMARAAALAGAVLEVGHVCGPGEGFDRAVSVINDGRAWRKFQSICEAQGGLNLPTRASHKVLAVADRPGRITKIDNRLLSKLAKLAGAPRAPAAGVELLSRLGDTVMEGDPVLAIHAETLGELEYALDMLRRHPEVVGTVEEPDDSDVVP